MNQQEYNRLREMGWRRRLTPTEQAELQSFLAANPATQGASQEDAELTQLLERLPEAPKVSSNFTARVLKAVELESAAETRKRTASPFGKYLHNWLPRTAAAALVISSLFVGYHYHQLQERAVLMRNVAGLAEAVSPDSELMKDFEPISRMSDTQPTADTELIALMK